MQIDKVMTLAELTNRETYLGDGLFASFDGWHIVLRAPREGGDHWIALEPKVFGALLAFERATLAAGPAGNEGTGLERRITICRSGQ